MYIILKRLGEQGRFLDHEERDGGKCEERPHLLVLGIERITKQMKETHKQNFSILESIINGILFCCF